MKSHVNHLSHKAAAVEIGKDSSSPKVSVVIPTYNRSDAAIRCIKSVLASTYRNVEIVVVDDFSSREVVSEAIRREFGETQAIKVVRHDRNRNVAASRNTGANAADGELLFFVDDDNELMPDAIQLLVQEAMRGRHDIIAPLAVNISAEGRKIVWATSFAFNPWTSIPRNTDANIAYTPEFAAEHRNDVYESWYSPNAFMVTRSALVKIKGFLEWFGILFEESDFGVRALENGMAACVVAGAVTNHNHYNDNGDMALRRLAVNTPRKAYLMSRNRLVFAMRHYSWLQLASVVLVFAPLLAVCYSGMAVLHRRFDIAFAYFYGHLAGLCRLIVHPPECYGQNVRGGC